MYNLDQIKSVSNILKKNKTNYWTGVEGKNFELDFSKYHNMKYSVAVSNGSVALEIALKSLNLKKTDEVIVTPRSFIASASCVLNLGMKPVFADVDENGNLDINGISKVYNQQKTKAVIIVHLNGLPCDLDPIVNFTKKKKIHLIEDCSQAHGAKYKGRPVGSFGIISTWSFCQDKIISTGGEGGIISTNNNRIWKFCWEYKDHGKSYHSVFKKKHKTNFKWLHHNLGSNYRLTEMQAVLGRHQLKVLDKTVKKRNQIANLYLNRLKNFLGKKSFFKKPNYYYSSSCVHAFYRLNLFLNNKKNQRKLIFELNKKKIVCGIGSCPEIYREKIFKKSLINSRIRLPNAKSLGETSIMFPVDPYKSSKIIKDEIEIIKKVIKKIS